MTFEPQRFVNPRRFSECFQASEDWPGTLAQQVAVRAALTVDHDTPQHKLLQKVDKEVNRRGRHFLPVAFVALPTWQLGRGFVTGILLSEDLIPVAIAGIVRHEFGHVYDQLFLTQSDKDWFMSQVSSQPSGDWSQYSEMFADAFRDWWQGTSWPTLTPILLRP